MSCPHYAGFTRAMCHRCKAEDANVISVREVKRDFVMEMEEIKANANPRQRQQLHAFLNEIAKQAKKRGY